MKAKKLWLFLGLIGVVAIMGISIFIADKSAVRAMPESPQRLEGSWVVTVTGEGLPSWYRALATFTQDGGLVETVTYPLLSTGHGAWARAGDRKFAITTVLLQFDPAGNFVGTLKARATLNLDQAQNEFTSDEYRFEFRDRDGNLIATGNGTAHGTRIVVEPLP